MMRYLFLWWVLIVANGGTALWVVYPDYKTNANCQSAADKINAQHIPNMQQWAFCINSN